MSFLKTTILTIQGSFKGVFFCGLMWLVLVAFLASCMPSKSPTTTSGPPTTGGSEGFSPPATDGQTGPTKPTKPTQFQTVYIFKYTGRRFGDDRSTSKFLMRQQLSRAGVNWKEEIENFEDGNTYAEEDGANTGDILVFAIDSNLLTVSEKQANFCQCTLKRAEKICEPYAYDSSNDSPPSCGR